MSRECMKSPACRYGHLTRAQLRRAKQMIADGHSMTVTARRMGCSPQHIRNVTKPRKRTRR